MSPFLSIFEVKVLHKGVGLDRIRVGGAASTVEQSGRLIVADEKTKLFHLSVPAMVLFDSGGVRVLLCMFYIDLVGGP